MKKLGYLLIILSIIFGITETIYFGNNILPNSNIEIYCDILAFILFISGTFIIKFKK